MEMESLIPKIPWTFKYTALLLQTECGENQSLEHAAVSIS